MKEGGLTAASFLPGPHGPSLHPPPHVTYPPGLSVTHPPGSAHDAVVPYGQWSATAEAIRPNGASINASTH